MTATRIDAPPTLRVCAPEEGWLSLMSPTSADRRKHLARLWRGATVAACRAAGLGRAAGPVRLAAVVRLRSVQAGYDGAIRCAEDVRPTLHQVVDGLAGAGVLPGFDREAPARFVGEVLRLGVSTGPAGGQGYLELWLTEAMS